MPNSTKAYLGQLLSASQFARRAAPASCAAMLGLLIVSLLGFAFPPFADSLVLAPSAVADGQVWRLVTGHLVAGHLLLLPWSLAALWVAGRRLEPTLGTVEWVWYSLIACLFASLLWMVSVLGGFLVAEPAGWTLIMRTNGWISALLVLALIEPDHWTDGPLRRPVVAFVACSYWMADLLLDAESDVWMLSLASPLGGALFALTYRQFDLRLTRWLIPTKWLHPSSHVELSTRTAARIPHTALEANLSDESADSSDEEIDPEEGLPMDAKLDKLLEKIAQHGADSLTEEEHQFLHQASALYRVRQQRRDSTRKAAP